MSLFIKRLTVFVATLLVCGSAIVVCQAGGPGKRGPMDPRGEPEGLKKGVTECFKVWHNSDGWHVRVVNGKGSRDHRYQGSIRVEDGVIEQIHSRLAKKNAVENQWKHGAKKNEITFDFSTFEKEDGINFKASKGATTVRFSLKIDGKEVPEQIFVGKRGDNPASASFTLVAHPGENNPEKVTVGRGKTSVK